MSSLDGSNPRTFLKTNDHGYLPGFGMTIKGDTLYALGNSLTTHKNKSVLLLIQLSSGERIDSYSMNHLALHYLNDLTVSSRNEIFITDSESNKIYKIQRPNKTIDLYMDSEEIANSNGITISENDEYLYLASSKGICVVEIKSKKVINRPNEEYAGIDGLKFYKNNLYAIVNGWSDTSKNGLFKYELKKRGTEILKCQKLVKFTKKFRTPTTFDIFNDNIYFIRNTQLDNFDERTNGIIEAQKLESYKLLKTSIE